MKVQIQRHPVGSSAWVDEGTSFDVAHHDAVTVAAAVFTTYDLSPSQHRVLITDATGERVFTRGAQA